MIIKSVSVENFGTIKDPIDVEFGQGLNVVHGPNETGKSTLMRAIWYAMTRRAQSGAQDIKKIIPDTGGVPRVELTLEIDGDAYQITKTFQQSKGTAHLRHTTADGDIRSYKNDEADEVLRQCLGFSSDTDHTKAPVHVGLWPLTWVKQGQDHSNPAERLQNDGKDDKLTETLGSLTGQALTGERGDQLLKAATEEYEKYFTASGSHTSAAGAPLHEAKKKLECAKDELAELKDKQRRYKDDLQRYAKLEEAIDKLKESDLPALKEDARNAVQDSRKIEDLREKRRSAQVEYKLTSNEFEKWQKILTDRKQLRDAKEASAEEKSKLADSVDEQGDELLELKKLRPELLAAQKEAEDAKTAASVHVRQLTNQLEILRLQEKQTKLQCQIAKARVHHNKLTDIRGELQGIDIDDDAVDELVDLRLVYETKEAELKAASARVEFAAHGDVALEIDGELLALEAGDERERSVDAPMALTVEDVLEIKIHPGDRDLVELRQEAARAKDDFDDKLSELDVLSVADAQKKARRQSELLQNKKSKEELFEQVAPDGLETLAQELKEKETRLEEAQEKLDATDGDHGPLPEDEEGCREELSDAREVLDRAERGFDEARAGLNDHDQRVQQQEHQRDLAEQNMKNARRRHDEASTALKSNIEEHGSDDEVEKHLEAAKTEMEAAEDDIADFDEQLETLQPEVIESTVERTERAVKNAEKELRTKSEEFSAIRRQLKSGDLHGLHEKLAQAEDDLERAEDDVDRWTRRAEASRLLYESLTRTRQEIRKAYLKPLRESVAQLLNQLFPGSTIEFDDEFRIENISRQSEGADTFARLSFGSREQLGILVRLAMAQLLARQGERLPVFLDDVLASSDDGRFQKMATVLDTVAGELQLIVTTCHWNRFRTLGAPTVVDLEAHKRGVVQTDKEESGEPIPV